LPSIRNLAYLGQVWDFSELQYSHYNGIHLITGKSKCH
jgi:hypothetical protein